MNQVEWEALSGRGQVRHADGRPVRVMDYTILVRQEIVGGRLGARSVMGRIPIHPSDNPAELIGVPLAIELADGRTWEFLLKSDAAVVSRGELIEPNARRQ